MRRSPCLERGGDRLGLLSPVQLVLLISSAGRPALLRVTPSPARSRAVKAVASAFRSSPSHLQGGRADPSQSSRVCVVGRRSGRPEAFCR